MHIEDKFKLDQPPELIYNRKKEDYIKIALNPGTISNINKNGDLVFEVDNQQSFLYLSKSFIYAEVALFQDDKFATPLPETDNITLEHNFFPRLFNSMRLEIGSQTIEHITDPGIYDTMIKFITISETKVKNQSQGWIPDNGSGNYVYVLNVLAAAAKPTEDDYNKIVKRLNLDTKNSGYTKRKEIYNKKGAKHSIKWSLFPLFGYTEYDKISYQLKLKLILHRTTDSNNESIFYGENGKKAYLKINKLEFHIPHITPSLELESIIMKRLQTNKPIPVTFLKRIASSYTFTGVETMWHFTRTSNTPRFILLAIQEENPSFERNNSRFILNYKYKDGTTDKEGEIRSIQVMLNQERYPIDPIRFDRTNNIFYDGYTAYENMCEVFGTEPQLNLIDWRDNYAIFCFDLSAQPEDLVKNGCDITIKIEKSESTKSLKAYAVALCDTKHFIELSNGRMVRIN